MEKPQKQKRSVKVTPRVESDNNQLITEVANIINAQLTRDLRDMRNRITEDVLLACREMISKEVATALADGKNNKMRSEINRCKEEIKAEVSASIKEDIADVSKQIVVSNNKQLAITKKLTQDVSAVVSRQVHASVIDEINRTIVPELDKMSQWVQYNTEDTTDMITSYRKAVHNQARQSDALMIGSGDPEKDKLVNFQKSLMFFSDAD
jgi:hypothetical protein